MRIEQKVLLFAMLVLFSIASVMAAGEITQDADKLNYWTAETHIVTVTNIGSLATNVTITSPWTLQSTDGTYCNNISTAITCILAASEVGNYTVTSDATVGEYATQAFALVANNSYTAETVTFVRIKDEEILKTLVEYGRGRGNYFYDSGTNRKGEQCTDLPALTDVELNYLHKIYPTINTYLNLPGADGNQVTLFCQYANKTITKTHLASNIVVGTTTDINYSSDWIKDSWEKVFYTVQNFDSTEQAVGSQIEVNCSVMKYYLADANGWVKVDTDNFALNFQNSSPITINAFSTVGSIGTGTSEVQIKYVVTNNEDITLSSSTNPITIDIQAPEQAEFIGTRGELFGTSLSSYRYELNSLGANEQENITLIARFNTDGTTPLSLSRGASVSFVPCWQINAYNPLATEQTPNVNGTIVVTGTAVAITGVQDKLDDILANLTILVTISTDINTTVNLMNTIITDINTTVNTNNVIINQINTTANTIDVTVNNINGTVTNMSLTVNNINSTVNLINSIVGYINTSRWGDYNASQLYDAIIATNTTASSTGAINYSSRFDNLDSNLTEIDTNLRQLEEFEEESIYLITDSITEGQTAYTQALSALNRGDKEQAISKLQESIDSLTQAESMIADIRADKSLTEAEKKSWITSVLDWVFAIFK